MAFPRQGQLSATKFERPIGVNLHYDIAHPYTAYRVVRRNCGCVSRYAAMRSVRDSATGMKSTAFCRRSLGSAQHSHGHRMASRQQLASFFDSKVLVDLAVTVFDQVHWSFQQQGQLRWVHLVSISPQFSDNFFHSSKLLASLRQTGLIFDHGRTQTMTLSWPGCSFGFRDDHFRVARNELHLQWVHQKIQILQNQRADQCCLTAWFH